jgi:hypothetical protein
MKKNALFTLTTTVYVLLTVLSGCATVKEMGKGFIGVSTQVLEEKRKDALKKSFALGYNDCYVKVKNILNLKDKESYIYAEDLKNKMIAIYLSSTDTTPVGIFFTEETGPNTLIEISSPSIYAKEEIANRIFAGLVSSSQSQKEKSIDDKEKTNN